MKKNLILLFRLLKAYTANIVLSKKPIKFIVFSQGRTGSTLLCNLLNSQNTIHCEGEILNRYKNFMSMKIRFPSFFLEGKSKLTNGSAFGFKVKVYQITEHLDLEANTFLKTLSNKGYKIIYLTRNNVLEQAVSTLAANKSGVYHLTQSEDKSISSIHVDKNTLEYFMQTRLDYTKDENEALSQLEILKIEYEKDLEHSKDWLDTVNKCYRYIDVPEIKSINENIKLRKNRIENLNQFIKNYDELKTEFSSSKFSGYFD